MYLTKDTFCVIYGNHLDIVQRMLDYDYLCGRQPSIKAIMAPDSTQRQAKVFFGKQEIFVPYIKQRAELATYAPCTILINLASARSAPQVVKEALETEMFTHIFTIAEGIPERETRELIASNAHLHSKGGHCMLLWPSIVGGIVSGTLRVGNTWGSLENMMLSKLWRPWSIGIVSKSGGMMNELCRVVANETDGVHTALQIGGDRYAMSTFVDIVRQYQENPEINMIVLLGELGNEDELGVADMIAHGELTKPLVAWVAGTSAVHLTKSVQFWHAGAQANSERETAAFKNAYLREKWAHVPESYETFGTLIGEVYKTEIASKQSPSLQDGNPASEKIPEDIQQKIKDISSRRGSAFTSTISDERGEELMYNKIPVTAFVEKGSLTNVLGHLRFKQQLPEYALDFLNTCLILLADHGPAVSGATTTIITARAGKDLVDSVAAGLLSIGPRFGGAITGAWYYFMEGAQSSMDPEAFMKHKRKQGESIIPGIGHKIKSIYNPDKRCALLLTQANSFPIKTHVQFAQAIEHLTTQKKPNLILNVDGMIAALLLDMLTDIWYTSDQLKETLDSGLFNGLFVLARTIGFIWHYADQKRLGEWLYRTARDDILYE